MIVEKVYNGRDNSVDLQLLADGSPVDLAPVTRMQLTVGETTLDSQANPAWFDWAPAPPLTGKVVLKLGAAGLTPAESQEAVLYVFDPGNPNGIRWGTFHLNIYAS
ncbi:MAG: hypothetical protein HY895_03175 [Deltaproteobacteria bacterium]|nr:hypothetical protein [Deltaproteobacteria bacterium]